MRLREALEECTFALLRRIAANSGMPVDDSTLRAELIQSLEHWLSVPANLAGSLSRLTPQEVEALALVRRDGWTAKAFVLDRKLPRGPLSTTGALAGMSPSLSLLRKGILFRGFDTVGEWRGEVYYVPEELRGAVAGVLPPPSPLRGPDLSAPAPPHVLETPSPAYDVFCLLSFLRREDRRLARGTLAAADLSRLGREAGNSSGPDNAPPERWQFLLHLCIAGGWVRRQGATLKPSRTAHQALDGGPSAIRVRLLETYLRDRVWSDLAAAGKVSQPVGSQRIREGESRRLLVHYLDEMAGEGWTDPAAFVAALYDSAPDVLRQDYSSLSWAVVDAASGIELQGAESWHPVEGEWIRYLLGGPLAWLGIVQWGGDSQGGRTAFRLHSSPGEAFAGLEEMSVDADLNVQVHPESDLSVAYRLEPYLELRRRGPVSLYRLTRLSVLQGLETGGSREELEGLLRQGLQASAGADVIPRVLEWADSHGRYRVEVALLLTAATQQEAEGIRDAEEIRACLETRLGPRTFRVLPERGRELIERLRRSGHSPKVDGNPRIPGARRALQDVELLMRCLAALRLVESLRPDLSEANAETVRRLEALLNPEELRLVDQRVGETLGKPPTS